MLQFRIKNVHVVWCQSVALKQNRSCILLTYFWRSLFSDVLCGHCTCRISASYIYICIYTQRQWQDVQESSPCLRRNQQVVYDWMHLSLHDLAKQSCWKQEREKLPRFWCCACLCSVLIWCLTGARKWTWFAGTIHMLAVCQCVRIPSTHTAAFSSGLLEGSISILIYEVNGGSGDRSSWTPVIVFR